MRKRKHRGSQGGNMVELGFEPRQPGSGVEASCFLWPPREEILSCTSISDTYCWYWPDYTWTNLERCWVLKNWCFWIGVLEKTLESPLDCKEIKLVNPKGNQPWIFIGRTDAEAPILGLPDVKSRLIGKDSDAGKDWGQKEKGVTEDEMVGWHHRLDGRGLEWTPGDGDGQGGLVWCDSWGHNESDTTERLNWLTEAWPKQTRQWGGRSGVKR